MDLKNDLLLRALMRQTVERTPVWIMRQAGRYLPEYLKTRAEAGSFMNLCQTPELACEVTLQPLRRYPLDAAIIFSDILTIPDAMGLGLHFVSGEGPKFENPVRSGADIRRLPRPDIRESLGYVMDAIALTRRELGGRVPLIGFSGSPWTLATYMIEGGSSKSFSKAKTLLYQEPAVAHELLEKLADTVTDYLNAQIHAGAQAVQIFDTWGGALSADAYREFSLQYMSRIVAGLEREYDGRRVPVIRKRL
jgi:uroporphyrinogen decarboxylase